MAGIYIHIPYCKQACIYCDFHFSTVHKNKSALLEGIRQEIISRKQELESDPVQTIYFGGGTPSICNAEELHQLLAVVYENYAVQSDCEITLEANPDDLDALFLNDLKLLGINRLSIGIQSFFDDDLRWMNRAHNGTQATTSILLAQLAGITNISADLIFATPLLTQEKLESNLERLIELNVPHISCYNLTVEEKTALHHQIKKNKINIIPEALAANQFYFIRNTLKNHGYEHYEISNYAIPGMRSRHNAAYWQGAKYLGFGPSAHSYNGINRSWNISNNEKYIKLMRETQPVSEFEILTPDNQFNEILLTGLRTSWGVSVEKLRKQFPQQFNLVSKQIDLMIGEKKLILNEGMITIAEPFLIIADGLVSELFLI